MSSQSLSRRSFLGQAGLGAAFVPIPSPPSRAWIIVALGWEYNDEFAYREGEYPQEQLFYDRAAADAECRSFCDTFFSSQTPDEFGVDLDCYDFGKELDFNDGDVTWEELRAGGFPEPYYVMELTVPGADR
jgi:hypothetical protein